MAARKVCNLVLKEKSGNGNGCRVDSERSLACFVVIMQYVSFRFLFID